MLVGLTGGFATGKTAVAKIFAKYGAFIIDADKIGHSILRDNNAAAKKIIKLFGKAVVTRNNNISRCALSRIVFGGKKKLAALSSIMHPLIINEIKNRAYSAAKTKRLVVIDAPLLFESGFNIFMNKTIVVTCARHNQLKRALSKFGISRSEALKRIALQMNLNKKTGLADFIIYNNGSFGSLEKQVKIVIQKIGA